ncbi:Uncharacterised protein [Actinomyces howellii]|uniref:Uncharacterized protein n=2 Tax=Actinomyces howellii TaxID=52771 RepID=A0A3S5EH48_9ACTO|nr:Uncharacterised protein [Actinomyces howellii]
MILSGRAALVGCAVVLVAISAAIALMPDDTTMIGSLIGLGGCLGLVGLFQDLAEREAGRRMRAALPVSRHEVLDAWWLAGGAGFLAATGVSMIIASLLPVNTALPVPVLAVLVAAVLASSVPLVLGRRGTSRVTAILALLFVEGLVAGFLARVLGGRLETAVLAAILGAGFAVVVVSWWLSHRLYARQDH